MILTPEWGASPGIVTCRSGEGTFGGDHKKGLHINDDFKEAVGLEEVQVVDSGVTLEKSQDDVFSGQEKNWSLQVTELPDHFQAMCWSDLGMSKAVKTGFLRLGKDFGSLRSQIFGTGSLKE